MTYNLRKLKTDSLLKDYFTDHCHFADMINAVIFDGRQVVHPDHVTDYDISTSTYYDDKGGTVTIDRDRDVIRKVTIGNSSILVGIENQSQEDWNMLFRVLEYNLLTQSRQWHQIRTAKELKSKPPVQSMSLVLNFGEKSWKGPRTYDEDLTGMPEEFQSIAGLRMFPVTDIIQIDCHRFSDQDNHDMVKGLQTLYQWNGEVRVFEGMVTSKIVALIIASQANNRKLLHIIEHKKEEKIDMCESMRLYTERISKQNREEGEKSGLIGTLVDQLKYKLGRLSPNIELEIENSDTEQLNQLKIRIFSIENEKDILDVLNNGNE